MGTILEYKDYTLFLKEYVLTKKKASPQWSLQVWSRKLKLKSPSTLTMILNGERHPSDKLIEEINKYFQFSQTEQEHFLKLIYSQKTKNNPVLSRFFQSALGEKVKVRFKTLKLKPTEYSQIAHWYQFVIKQMIHVKDFSPNPKWISNKLIHKIEDKIIQSTLDDLIKFELIKESNQNSNLAIKTTEDVPNETLRNLHLQMIDLAKSAVNNTPVKKREIRTMSFAIKDEDLPIIKERLRTFMNELYESHFCEKDADQVYQLNFQLFPLTNESTRGGKL